MKQVTGLAVIDVDVEIWMRRHQVNAIQERGVFSLRRHLKSRTL
jgi:hypothetical protein